MIVIPLQSAVRYVRTFLNTINNNNSTNTGNTNFQNILRQNATNTNVSRVCNTSSLVDNNNSNDNKNNNYENIECGNMNLCEQTEQPVYF